MTSATATAHPVVDHAHHYAALDARTLLAADHAAERTIAVVTAGHVRRVVRRAREVISLTDRIVEARAPIPPTRKR